MTTRMIFDIAMVAFLLTVLIWQMHTMIKLKQLTDLLDEIYEMVSNDLDDVPPMTISPITEPLSKDKLDELRFGKKTNGTYHPDSDSHDRDDYTP